MARWIRQGACIRCGKCCKTLVSEWFMTGYDPVKGPRTTGCIYLEERPDGRYDCLIRSGEIDFDGLSPQVRGYYRRECLDYPNSENLAHCPPRHELPEGCGFKIEEAV